jgi:hypothetical protein
MKIIDVVQGTPEWFAAKCGVPSASNFDKLLTSSGQPSKQHTKYLYRLAGETITGIAEESYQSAAMVRGIELEAEARELYQLISGKEVKEVGFCLSNGYGASPDGFVGKNGLVEIKCPSMAIHIGYLLSNTLPMEYFQQCQGQLLITGRKWVDFVSYYPGLKPLIIRVKREGKFLTALQAELEVFCSELKDLVKKLR